MLPAANLKLQNGPN